MVFTMKRMANLVAVALLCVSAVTAQAQSIAADIVIRNANIRTMDASRTTARSVAILNGKIVALGTDAETRIAIGPKTRVIDAFGRLVMPGFDDAHVHFSDTGAQLSRVDLRTSKSPQEFVARLKAFIARQPKGRWILGGRWDHENWTPANLPTADMIDAISPNNPVFVSRLDGHQALANRVAMTLAGVDKSTRDVEGGVIVRDAQGNPTGNFKDAAEELIRRVIPETTYEEELEYAQAASDWAAHFGVTSVQSMEEGTNFGAFQELERRGTLKTRIYGCTPLADYQRWSKAGVHYAFGDSFVRVGCLKAYADGSLGSTTAWFFAPYLDSPDTAGVPRAEVNGSMRENMVEADKAGLQVMTHAIGDRANATILDFYESVAKANGGRDRRYRVEHAQHLRQQDIPRFASLNVIASMQPIHLADDGRWAAKRLDETRLRGTYAFRSLLDAGARLAFGTDSPVASLDPLLGIWAAVTRQTADGKNPNGWFPEQKITVDEAVRCYTLGSAYAEFQEKTKGTFEVGKLADVIMLSDDIFTIDPVKIKDAKVLLTIVDGKVVYETAK
jgi:predicted amidohydrolase YtcJ